MALISGKYAEALIGSCEFMEFESWEFDGGYDVLEVPVRSAGGWMATVESVGSGRGTITGYIDPDAPITATLTSGALVTLVLRTRSAADGGLVKASGTARLGKFQIAANRSGEPQSVTIPFTADGPWLLQGQS